MTSSDYGDEDSAQRYDAACADMFAPEILGPAVAVLAEYAGAGRALEFAIGPGRVGIPLRERGLSFPPNRGGFGYAASRAGAAVFS